ncbi:HAD family hydrolase [Methylocapsa sp. S129]|uniref:HAD family hydrolase n=1 Tax=Methylocapsa sp. S129 TaxID=1641869 RepID=UPI00131B8630|nr:HAD family hydrolase [Methylocapsa sp. S129]
MSADLRLSAIGFDADDTLWRHQDFYERAEARFAALLAGHGSAEDILLKLREVERRNLPLYGFGVKGFTLSMIETAVEATGGQASAALTGEILSAGRELLRHPIEILPHVREALGRLAGAYRLILVTKGDLLDQERKLEESGLASFFDAVEIVSDKKASTYARVFARHADGPERAMMVGNSLKSDVIPAIEAGAWGVYVPQALVWAEEHSEPPPAASRFHRLDHLGELAELVARLC